MKVRTGAMGNTPLAVIFDLDGVLVDSTDVMRQAFSLAYAEVVGPGPAPFAEYNRHLGRYFPDIMRIMGLPLEMEEPFVRMRHLLETSEAVARVARVITDAWQDVHDRLGEGERALLVAHGGVMELGLAASIAPGEGAAFDHCEGFELSFEDGVPTAVRFYRL